MVHRQSELLIANVEMLPFTFHSIKKLPIKQLFGGDNRLASFPQPNLRPQPHDVVDGRRFPICLIFLQSAEKQTLLSIFAKLTYFMAGRLQSLHGAYHNKT